MSNVLNATSGILLIDKPKGKTSFSLVNRLRKLLGVKKIGHAGTLDPFASGVMVMLIGREYTKKSDSFLNCDKEYTAELKLGTTTDTFDCEGQITKTSLFVPTDEMVKDAIETFQGILQQIPPMFSAKKIDGKKLYELARKGQTIERKAAEITVEIQLIDYQYPFLRIHVKCSKGTYIRSLAHDLGIKLTCGAHLTNLKRTKSGHFSIDDCINGVQLFDENAPTSNWIDSVKTDASS